MSTFHAVVCQIIYPWLSVQDLIKLDSAGMTSMHREICRFIRSPTFVELYECELNRYLQCSAILDVLEWMRYREVFSSNCFCVPLNDAMIEALIQLPSPVPAYLTINSIELELEKTSSILSFTYLAHAMFPSVDRLSMSFGVYDYNKTPHYYSSEGLDHAMNAIVLTSLFILSKGWKIKSLSYFHYNESENPENTMILFGRLLQQLGSSLTRLRFINPTYVSSQMLDLLVTHCPNAESPLSGARLIWYVTPSHYVHVCQRLPRLCIIDLTGHLLLSLTDNIVIPVLPGMTNLSVLRMGFCRVSWAFMAAAVQHCPLLTELSTSFSTCLIHQNSSGARSSRLVIRSMESIAQPEFLSFLAVLPCWSCLILKNDEQASSDWLELMLRQLEHCRTLCQGVTRISLGPLDLFGAAPLLVLFPNLTALKVGSLHLLDRETDASFSSSMASIAALCPSINQLSTSEFSPAIILANNHVDKLIKSFVQLDCIELYGFVSSSSLTCHVLLSLASTGKLWRRVVFPPCLFSAEELIDAVAHHGLRVQRLQCGIKGKMCVLEQSPRIYPSYLRMKLLGN